MSATVEAVRERPILFSGPMVRAILDGRKSQTRRVMTLKRRNGQGGPVLANPAYVERWKNEPAEMWARECPYGVVGDRLWVRETWRVGSHDRNTIWFRADEGTSAVTQCNVLPDAAENLAGQFLGDDWKPSIHMYRWASRITLEITEVRVERIQSISYADVLAEGCPIESVGAAPADHDWYRMLWDSLNASRGYSWESNPWVWAISFRRVDRALDAETGQ